MIVHAAIHPLTPGNPAYALAKLTAVGGLIALRIAMSRRGRSEDEPEAREEAPPPAPRPHPVSRRKARRRRRSRR